MIGDAIGCHSKLRENPIAWKRPCYLIADGPQLINETKREVYGPGHNPRCADCCSEASAVEQMGRDPRDMWRAAAWIATACGCA